MRPGRAGPHRAVAWVAVTRWVPAPSASVPRGEGALGQSEPLEYAENGQELTFPAVSRDVHPHLRSVRPIEQTGVEFACGPASSATGQAARAPPEVAIDQPARLPESAWAMRSRVSSGETRKLNDGSVAQGTGKWIGWLGPARISKNTNRPPGRTTRAISWYRPVLSAMFIDACWVQTTSKEPSANGISRALAWTNDTRSARWVHLVSVSPTAQYSAVRSSTVTLHPKRYAS